MNTYRRPFWVPASNYYMLALAACTAFFFVVWGALRENGDETPWITAGVGASVLLAGAVIVRAGLLRRARLVQPAPGLDGRTRRSPAVGASGKLTLQANAAILADIRLKSEAANVLGKFASGHREVFELCGEYMARNEKELKDMRPDSPRLAALLRGRTTAAELHRYHLLRWTEIEARSLASGAGAASNAGERIAAARNALNVVSLALSHYPTESSLLESSELLESHLISIKVADLVEKAERFAFDGDFQAAIASYRDALFELAGDHANGAERDHAAERITGEIEKLRGQSGDAG